MQLRPETKVGTTIRGLGAPSWPGGMKGLVHDTFLAEARAPKPGNVSLDSPGHGMSYADFAHSAAVASTVLADPTLTPGERILHAQRRTFDAVNCNTNLGMLLLFAPLVAAAEQTTGTGGTRALRVELGQVLAALGPADGECIYTAIREAVPGGLGHSEHYDVNAAPAGKTLLAAMHHARNRDRIARQYVSAGEDIFCLGVPSLLRHSRTVHGVSFPGGPLAWMVTACYIDFLTAFPDSHVSRRHGPRTAAWLRGEADTLKGVLARGDKTCTRRLAALDERLKRDGINPGTSADLTAAALLAYRLAGLPVLAGGSPPVSPRRASG